MGMVVRTNTMAMNANRQLGVNNTQVGKSLEKLSSGFRINRAADDASGLAISEKMKAQIKGLEQASANSQDGISLIQTAEGATQEIHNMLNRMVELATKSANGTIQDKVDREAIQREVDDLNSEITRISKSTNFNGIALLDGTMGGGAAGGSAAATVTSVKVAGAAVTGVATTATKASSTALTVEAGGTGAAAGTITVKYKGADGNEKTITTAKTTGAFTDASTAKDNGAELATTLNANTEFAKLFTAKADTTSGALTIEAKSAGAMTITEVSTTALAATGKPGVATKTTGMTAGAAAGTTYDMGGTMATGDEITVDGQKYTYDAAADGTGTTFKDLTTLKAAVKLKGVTADITTTTAVTFTKNAGAGGGGVGGLKLQVGDTNDDFNHVTVSVDDLSAAGIKTDGLLVSTQDAAGASIQIVKDAINKVSTNRANLGSLQNRLEYTISNLDTTTENMTAANSRIRDTDMAKEMMNYTKMNILTQAAQAMLAQANQQPQAILQLLQ